MQTSPGRLRAAIEWMRIDVERVHWFSTYRVHHRVADRFWKGRAFLLGYAAFHVSDDLADLGALSWQQLEPGARRRHSRRRPFAVDENELERAAMKTTSGP